MPDLRVGFATSDITPPVGVELCGFGWYLGRKSTGVIEPLLARAMVWESGTLRGALIVCDLVGITRDLAAAVRSAVSRECGIAADNAMISATHTHSGPATIDLIGWGEKDADYLASLPGRIAAAAAAASKLLSKAALAYGEAPVAEVSFNREYKGGITDTRVRVLSFTNNGALLGFLANFSCHPVVMCAPTFLISGDFTGLAVNAMAARHRSVGIFLQGSSGDQNPIYRFQPQDEAIRSLHILADRFDGCMEKALAAAVPVEVEQVCVQRREISLPQNVPDRPLVLRNLLLAREVLKNEALPDDLKRRFRLEEAVSEAVWRRYDRVPIDGRKTEIQALRFGAIVLATHPAELFHQFHQEVEDRLSPLKTLVVGYANDYVGYVAAPDRYDVSGQSYSYPAYFVPFLLGEFPFRPDVGAVLTDAIVELVHDCEAGSR